MNNFDHFFTKYFYKNLRSNLTYWLTEKLTCSRRLSCCSQLYSHFEQMQKAAIQRSVEGADQVQRVLGRNRIFQALILAKDFAVNRWFSGHRMQLQKG
jgi:hypothetical protein